MSYTITGRAVLDLLAKENLLISADDAFEKLCFKSVSFDSRETNPDGLFFCKGAHFKDVYLADARAHGAIGCLAMRKIDEETPCAIVSDVNLAMGLVAKAFYADPQNGLNLIGVTGTNGKTTVVYNIVSILNAAFGQRPAFTSTAESFDGTNLLDLHLTTPEAPVSYALMAHAKEAGVRNYVMECSSQSTKMHRAAGMRFDYGVFTNISSDHVAPHEHPTFEEYLNCKLGLVRRYENAVINLDDPHAADAIDAAKSAKRVVTYSIHADTGADVFAQNIERDGLLTRFTVVTPDWERQMVIDRPGIFNVSNALAAAAVAYLMGIDPRRVVEGIESCVVPGRMQLIEKNGYRVFVDYAHNKESVAEACRAIREIYPEASLQILFGCSGFNGYQRRWEIPQTAAPYCKYMYITTEDPFDEDPQSIIDEIVENVRRVGCPYTAILDLEECVRFAIAHMTRNDVLLIANKGEEAYQKMRGKFVRYKGNPAIVQEALNGLD